MKANEARHRVIAVLLQAGEPLTLGELVARCGLGRGAVARALEGLVDEALVASGNLAGGGRARQYRWAARWRERARSAAADSRRAVERAVGAAGAVPPKSLDVDSPPAEAFHRFIIDVYAPPPEKRFCVFLQCSVRRPFSSSPSHAAMRRGIAVATGFDPRTERQRCCVHVVVLASRIGPVPYELEETYPANVGGGGVKHFRPEHYARVRGVLARRMAEYIAAHAGRYEHMATFTHGRYGEVMADAARIAGVELPVFPRPGGARIARMGKSRPRTYWAKCWIQLYQEITGWLTPAQRRQAAARLEALDVEFT